MGLTVQRIELASVDSTNTYAKGLAAQGAEAGTLVFAHAQTAGRGRQGNTWEARPGNLYASLILRPQVSASDVGQLSFVTAVALAETIAALMPGAVIGLKWPNDVFLNGKKCAGILLESEGAAAGGPLPWVVAGFGVNLADAPQGAASLAGEGGAPLAPAAFLDRLEPALCHFYDEWAAKGFSTVRRRWLDRALRLGEKIEVRLVRETLAGTFEDIDDHGVLHLRLDDGSLRHISSGEVYL